MRQLIIGPAGPEDIDDIVAIEVSSFDKPWSRQSFKKDLDGNPYAVYIVARVESGTEKKAVGYMGLWITGGDEGSINTIAVLPEYRRKHVASAMLWVMLHLTETLGITAHTLEVRISNEAAIALYESFGFKKEGLRKNYYDDPMEDAIIMWRHGEEMEANKGVDIDAEKEREHQWRNKELLH